MAYALTATRLLLGHGIRGLRMRVGMNTSQAVEVLGLKQLSTYRRYEHGEIKIPLPHLKVLLAEWGATDEERRLLLELQQQADQDGWWSKYPLTESMSKLVSFENLAVRIRVLESALVFGPLQTPDYARAAVCAIDPPGTPEETIERTVRLRADRRAHLLRSDDPPDLRVVFDESVLRREVGSRAIMRQQLATLADLPRSCELRILPFRSTAHPGLAGAFHVFEFPPELRRPAVYVPGPQRNAYLDTPADVQRANVDFDRVWEAAVDRVDSRELILTTMEEWSA